MHDLARRSTRRTVNVAVAEVATVQQLHNALQVSVTKAARDLLAIALICSSWASVNAIAASGARHRGAAMTQQNPAELRLARRGFASIGKVGIPLIEGVTANGRTNPVSAL